MASGEREEFARKGLAVCPLGKVPKFSLHHHRSARQQELHYCSLVLEQATDCQDAQLHCSSPIDCRFCRCPYRQASRLYALSCHYGPGLFPVAN